MLYFIILQVQMDLELKRLFNVPIVVDMIIFDLSFDGFIKPLLNHSHF